MKTLQTISASFALAIGVMSPFAAAAPPDRVEKIPFAGTVAGTGAGSETVRFTGTATVTQRIATDAVFRKPALLILYIDFSSVVGTGTASGRRYVTDSQAIIHRQAVTQDRLEVPVAFHLESDLLQSRTGLARFEIRSRTVAGTIVDLPL